ncbi:MAG: DUF2490 domain-containing protein [Bacteroidetes bacterium]|nr:DUF2490 domain-containing protein [Bacteroidota bacterium]
MKMKINKLKIVMTLIISVITVNAFAQEENPDYTQEFQGRAYVSIKKSFLDKSLNVELSPEVRFGNDFNYNKTLIKLNVDYDILNWFNVGVGGRAVFNKTNIRDKEGVENNKTEITGRYDFDISKKFKLGKFKLKPRIRYSNYDDYEIFDDYNKKGALKENDNSDFLRYKVSLTYKFAKKAIFEPEVGVELFHKLETNKISSIRYNFGGDFRLSKHSAIGVNYLVESEFKIRELTHIAEVGYKYKF